MVQFGCVAVRQLEGYGYCERGHAKKETESSQPPVDVPQVERSIKYINFIKGVSIEVRWIERINWEKVGESGIQKALLKRVDKETNK